MLFNITSEKVHKNNPEILGIEEFDSVDDRVLKWIFFCYDYESPYRRIPLETRRSLLAEKLLFSETKGTKFDKFVEEMLKGNVPAVQKAIAAFKELQYDDDRETLEAVKLAIRDLRDMLGKPASNFKDAKTKAELGQKIRQLAEEKKMLEQIFELRGPDNDDSDVPRQSSELDEFMENMREEKL